MSIKTLSLAAAIALSLGLSTSVWAADDATPPPAAGAAADTSKAAEGDDAKKECIPKAEADAPAAEGEAPADAPAAEGETPADAPADAEKEGDDDAKLPPCGEDGKPLAADAEKEGDSAAAGDASTEAPATEKAK